MPKIAEVAFRQARRIVQSGFPGASSRRSVKVETTEHYHVHDYWDGGSRYEARFVNLDPIRALSRAEVQAGPNTPNPYGLADYQVEMLPTYCVVEHCIFQGKDLGYRIYLHPSHAADWQQHIKE